MNRKKRLAIAGVIASAALSTAVTTAPAHATQYGVNLNVGNYYLNHVCLDADGSAGTVYNGQRVTLFECNTSDPYQVWDLWSDGTIRLSKNVYYCLDANMPNGTLRAGAPVTMWQCNGGANQQWNRYSDGVIHSAVDQYLVLDATGGQPIHAGQPIEVWNQNGYENQRWWIWS